MNANWFSVKIRYVKTMDNGTLKRVTESYLFDALSFTEAEKRAIEQLIPYITGEFEIADVKRAKYSEVFTSDEEQADKWFTAKLEFITIDEKTAVEKTTSTNVLVQCANLEDGLKKLHENMKGTMADYNAVCLKDSGLFDVYFNSEK